MEKETARMEGFSDAIFAIAITLLVLELHVPEAATIQQSNGLAKFLAMQWPSYLAFSLSFFSIYIMWINHHKIFKQIYSRNTGITFANGVILFFASLVSYPTALLAQFFDTGYSSTAVAIYTGLFLLINLSYLWLWHTASSDRGLLRPNITNEIINGIKREYLYSLPVYIIAFLLSFWIPVVSLIICTAMWIYWTLMSGKVKM